MKIGMEGSRFVPPGNSTGPTKKRLNSPFASLYHKMDEPVFVDDGRRRVCAGRIANGVFVKELRQEHLLRRPAAIAVQATVLSLLETQGVGMIEARIDDGRILRAPVARFVSKGFRLNRDFGEQVALALGHWDDANSPQEVLSLW